MEQGLLELALEPGVAIVEREVEQTVRVHGLGVRGVVVVEVQALLGRDLRARDIIWRARSVSTPYSHGPASRGLPM